VWPLWPANVPCVDVGSKTGWEADTMAKKSKKSKKDKKGKKK
jgi:hypothetical protein